MSYSSLVDKVVVITGGASGIGASLVEHFVKVGSRVIFFDIDRAAGEELALSLSSVGNRPCFQELDLCDIKEFQKRLDALGHIDVLINNAARDDRHQLQEVTEGYWKDCLDVNLKHYYFACQSAAKLMKRGGSIVNMSSITWVAGMSGMSVYAMSNAAISGMTRVLARELGQQRIRVNSIVPGWVMTPRQTERWATPTALRQWIDRQCLSEFVTPADIAQTALFLASDQSKMITGQEIHVNGGFV